MTQEITHPDKLLWPADGFTKKDLIDYYQAAAPLILKELEDRLLTLVRAPDGVGGQTFFQKNAPKYTPEWIRTVTVPAPSAKREVSYLVCESAETLTWIGNQAGLELHPNLDRASKPGYPDLLVFDMDPPEGRFDLAAEAALVVRDLLRELGLEPSVKTTGGKGLHVYLRIERRNRFGAVHEFAYKVGQRAVAAAENLMSLEFKKKDRGGRVFVDVHRNGPGATIVAPFSPRARAGAHVSFPVGWDGVPKTDPGDFNLATAAALLDSRPVKEWKAKLKEKQRLPLRRV
ncbi:MAG: non-homologous end-joining DNA ligase [Acidimicrobiia bacterium]